MEPAKNITQEIYTMLCHHQTDDGGVKFVMAECGNNPNTQHKISQWGQGYICPYCSQIIQKACKATENDSSICHHCRGDLEQFIASKQICQHDNPTISSVKLVCINSNKDEPFQHILQLGDKKICEACEKKLTYKYQDQDTCKICDNKTKQLLANLKGSLANQELRMIKRFLALLSQRKHIDDVKAQLQGHCPRSQQQGQQHKNHCHVASETNFISEYQQLNHKNNKFEFYTKCPKHRDIPISVCSTCVAVLLNINSCPFGCDTKSLNQVKLSKGKVTFSTGFIIFSPLIDPRHMYDHTLSMVIVQNIDVIKKLDQTQITSRNLYPLEVNQIKVQDYPTYSSLTKTPQGKYVLSGGLIAKSPTQITITGNVWIFTISEDKGQLKYSATKLPDLITPRSSHESIVINDELYIIGGFNGKQYLTSCEKFNFKDNNWTKLPNLNYPRSKFTLFPIIKDGKTDLVVLGGSSVYVQVYDYAQTLNLNDNQWQKVSLLTNSFGAYPFSSGRVVSTQNAQLAKYQNILLFGGSNLQEYSNSIDEFSVNEKQNNVEFKQSGLQLETRRCFSEIGVLQTSDKQKKKIVLFGGLLEHESILNIEIINVQIKNKKMTPTYTDIVGSRMVFSELIQAQWQRHYKGIIAQLKSSGKLNDNQLKTAEKRENRHFLDTIWFSGKPVANYVFASEK